MNENEFAMMLLLHDTDIYGFIATSTSRIIAMIHVLYDKDITGTLAIML